MKMITQAGNIVFLFLSFAGDALQKHNEMMFTTLDKDNDIRDNYICGRNLKGGMVARWLWRRIFKWELL